MRSGLTLKLTFNLSAAFQPLKFRQCFQSGSSTDPSYSIYIESEPYIYSSKRIDHDIRNYKRFGSHGLDFKLS